MQTPYRSCRLLTDRAVVLDKKDNFSMLMLRFRLNDEQYALESQQIIEVVPLVELKKQPHAPNYISGMFNYRGSLVPVLDLCQLIQGRPCVAHLSTRIILVNYFSNSVAPEQATATRNEKEPSDSELPRRSQFILGLMAERVVETLNTSETNWVDAGIHIETAPYLGKMLLDQQGMIQCIRIENLLTAEQSILVAAHDTVGN